MKKSKAKVASAGTTTSVQEAVADAGRQAEATNKPLSTKTLSVQDVVVRAMHLGEVAAIIRALSAEIAPRFNGVGREVPELLLERDGSGARPATIDAIIAAEGALDELAADLERRAGSLVMLPVDVSEAADQLQAVRGIGVDRVVHRDHLDTPLRPERERTMPSTVHQKVVHSRHLPPRPIE
ncbi:MAG: hypothetical protein KF764_00950 [Labilithrix sp.]|nr:hypothetical protein [Labilithrix sp.]